MPTKSKTTKKSQSTVVRVSAKDTAPKPKVKSKKTTKSTPVATKKSTSKNPLKAIGGYFKGAWEELRQVRWPNRRATWSMTAALLAFTAFFVALILLLDALFKYIFQLILG